MGDINVTCMVCLRATWKSRAAENFLELEKFSVGRLGESTEVTNLSGEVGWSVEIPDLSF